MIIYVEEYFVMFVSAILLANIGAVSFGVNADVVIDVAGIPVYCSIVHWMVVIRVCDTNRL